MHLRISRKLRWGLLIFMGLLVFISLSLGLRHNDAHVNLQPPLPQDPHIQVYFNQSQAASYIDPYQQRERLGDDLEQMIVEAIASAQTSIDVAVQELRLPRIAQALRNKHQSGVRVRVVLENQYSRPWSQLTPQEISTLDERDRADYDEFMQFADVDGDRQVTPSELAERDALAILQTSGVPMLDDTADGSKGSGLMHHKVLIIDRQRVLVGSANFTLSGTHGDFGSPTSVGNANHVVLITSPALAQIFSQEFELLWGDGPGRSIDSQFGLQKPYRPPQRIALSPNSAITVQFSPTSPSRKPWTESVNGLIGRFLDTATQSVNLALFVFSDQNISNVLQTRQQAGVQVRALIDSGFAYRNYSEGLDLMGVVLPDNRCRYEDNNRPWSTPLNTVGVPQLADGDLLHHKFGVIDGRIVITGSQNWSEAANSTNDENLLVIENATVAAHFEREFERLYATASLGVPTWLQEKMSQQIARCFN